MGNGIGSIGHLSNAPRKQTKPLFKITATTRYNTRGHKSLVLCRGVPGGTRVGVPGGIAGGERGCQGVLGWGVGYRHPVPASNHPHYNKLNFATLKYCRLHSATLKYRQLYFVTLKYSLLRFATFWNTVNYASPHWKTITHVCVYAQFDSVAHLLEHLQLEIS